MTIINCLFLADASVRADYAHSVTIQSSKFSDGMVGTESKAHVSDTDILLIKNCSFVNITSSGFGSCIKIVTVKDALVEESMFRNTRSGKSGGSIAVKSYKPLNIFTVKNCIFLNTSSKFRGGSIEVTRLPYPVSVRLYNCNFTDTAGTDGGAVALWSNTGFGFSDTTKTLFVTLENCTFVKSTGIRGGAIFLEDVKTFTIRATPFRRCSATEYGGAVFAKAIDSVYINQVKFTETIVGYKANSNGGTGGGLYVEYSGFVNLSHSMFQYNKAQVRGGAFASKDTSIFMTVTLFQENKASYGGAIKLFQGRNKSARNLLRNCTFTHNTATISGQSVHSLTNLQMEYVFIKGIETMNSYHLFIKSEHAILNNIHLKSNTEDQNRQNYFLYHLASWSTFQMDSTLNVRQDYMSLRKGNTSNQHLGGRNTHFFKLNVHHAIQDFIVCELTQLI